LAHNYKSEIEFKPRDVISTDIARHFREYYRYTFRNRRRAGEEGNYEDDDYDYEGSGDLSTQAEEFFLTVFSNVDGFDSEETLESTFEKAKSCDDTVMLTRLNKAMDRIWASLELTKENSVYELVANTPTEMNALLNRFIDRKSDDSEAFWPIVARVRTYFDSALLGQGFTIADCPGITDTNKQRRECSESYMATCSAVLVVGDIIRVGTDSSIRDYLQKYRQLKKSSNIILIATRMDLLQTELKGLDKTNQQRLAAIEKKARDAYAEMEKAQAEEDTATSGATRASEKEQLRLVKARELATKTNDEAVRQVKREKLLIRSEGIEAKLLKESNKSGSYFHGIRCIPVGSLNQLKYIQGFTSNKPEKTPALGPTEDGFRALRAALSEMAQAGRLESLKRHCTETMQISINRLILTLDSTVAQRKGDLLRIIDDKSAEVALPVNDYVKALVTIFETWVQVPMEAKVNTTWIVAAGQVIEQFAREYKSPRTMLAFCKKEGVFKPQNKERKDWNFLLLEPTMPDIDGFVNQMKTAFTPMKNEIKHELRKIFTGPEGVRKELEANENFGGKTMDAFWSQFEKHIRNAEHSCDLVFEAICADFELCVQQLYSDGSQHDFHAAMNVLYTDIISPRKFKKGQKGITADRWAYLKAGVTKTSARAPFPSLVLSFRRNFVSILNKHHGTISDIIAEPFENIRQDLNALFRQNDDIDDEARAVVNHALKVALAQVKVYQDEQNKYLVRLHKSEEARHRAKKAKIEKED